MAAAPQNRDQDSGTFGCLDSAEIISRPLVDIRQLDAGDEEQLQQLLLALDEEGEAAQRSTARHASAGSDASLSADWVAGAFADERLCGVVAVDQSGGTPGVALAVNPQWRRQGLGSALLRAAIDWALRSGARKLRIVFARSDFAMRKLAVNFGAQLDLMLGDIVAEIELAPRLLGD